MILTEVHVQTVSSTKMIEEFLLVADLKGEEEAEKNKSPSGSKSFTSTFGNINACLNRTCVSFSLLKTFHLTHVCDTAEVSVKVT